MKKLACFTVIGLSLLTLPLRAQINLLHAFTGGTADGINPYGSVIISGTTLYGMTHFGGDHGHGAIFKVQTNGSGFTLLH